MAWPFGGAEPIQLFVKMMNSQAPPMEINVDANDIIKIIHEKILVTWKIPVTEQKLFYETKQLKHCDTLKECSIQNKACLELMVRWDDKDDSSALPQMIHQMSSNICRMCQGESDSKYEDCCSIISQALDCMTEENSEILSLYSVPATLVLLYSSPIEGNKFDGNNLIRLSMDLILMTENELSHDEIASLGLEFCNLLREVSSEDPLYNSCRTMLAEYLEDNYEIYYGCYLRTVIQILLFAVKLSQDLSNGLANLFYRSEHIEPLRIQVRDLGKFLCVLRKAINVLINEDEDEDDEQNRMVKFIVDVIKVLFHLHLKDMEQNLTRLADMKQIFEKLDTARPVSLLYLAILNELNSMSQLVEGAADEFKRVLEGQRNSLQIMIKNIMRSDDYDWLLEHIDVLDSESRMHLLMMKMFPEKKLHNAGLLNTLFCWSEKLDKKLFNAFKGKDLTDPKVLHHWLCKVCQVLFEPKNLLFRVCADYPTEFYPNPELQPEPFHLDCFNFAGKVIALALKHEIQVGVALDRVFLMQLAGKNISLEDVKNADPCFYNRSKEFINKDDLSTLESPKVKFGFKTGKTMKLYPSKGCFESLVRHCFVRSVSKQVSIFSEGFQMIFGTSISQLLEDFKGLELKDLNCVLKGNVNAGSNFGKKGKSLNHECNESDPLMSQLQKIRRPRINMKDCQLGEFLGSGSFGKVYEGYVADCPLLEVAPLLERKKVDQIEQEIALLRQFSHPNIVKYFGTDKDEMNLYIFLELVGAGSLEKHYQKFQLQDSEVSLYTKQILKGLKYLHDRNVVHGDIKCANILVDVKKCVKIADFGLSRVTNLKTLFKFCWWNPRWMPPEVVNGKGGGYGFKIDIWSVGCTVLEMSTRKIPYSHLEPGAVDYSIGEGKLPPLPDSLTEHSRDFILQCLQVNPNDRPTAAELLEHPFVKGRCLSLFASQ